MLMTKDKIIQDLEDLYQEALKNKTFQTALRAKELQCKLLGFFKTSPPKTEFLEKITPHELKQLIEHIEQNFS